jgi:hypothetical protein
MSSNSDETFMQRDELVAALNRKGIPVTEAQLKRLGTKGPPCVRYGNVNLYRLSDALAWFETQLKPPRAGFHGTRRMPTRRTYETRDMRPAQ